METPRENLALFIDFENFGSSQTLNLDQLTSALSNRGRLLIKRAYADWGRFSGYKHDFLRHAIDLTELPAHGKKGKNSADIKLVVDALEVALTMGHVDTFVVASGDSDYTPLFSKLREYGRTVIVAGIRGKINPLLETHCDETLYLGDASQTQQPAAQRPPKSSVLLLLKALERLHENGIATRGAQIKPTMRQLTPGFDETKLGFKRFRDFVEAVAKIDHRFSLAPDGDSDYLVTVKASDQKASCDPGLALVQQAPQKAKRLPPPAPANIEQLVCGVLAAGPLPPGEIARQLKACHFADDEGTSVTGLRRHVQGLITSGFLTHNAIGEQHVLCLAENALEAESDG